MRKNKSFLIPENLIVIFFLGVLFYETRNVKIDENSSVTVIIILIALS